MNKGFAILLVLWALCLVAACSNSVSEFSKESGEVAQETEDMIRLSGGTVTLGSNGKEFKPNETPAMKVVLDYDFYMDVHEVTCGEYDEVAREANLKRFDCAGDSLPIVNVTYYDAILFANAKSRREKRDTVYTYSKATYDGEGHCTDLEGISFRSEVEGYRLPTEAEWVFAATRAWDAAKSWNGGNSGYTAHEVCSMGADSAGFCDMAGNVMEWVNDWLGLFRDTTVTNYVGASDGGDLGERVLKGGNYTSSIKEINVASRGDVYTVTSSTRAEYVGFRLAFGKIPDAVRMSNSGKVTTVVVTPVASSETVKSLAGTYNVKLAFRNDVTGNLAYIDYMELPLSVTEIEDTLDVYHPDISPDGNLVAFCTKIEGLSGKSVLYVRDLNKGGSNLARLDVGSAAIPRWRVLENGDTVIVYVSDAGNNKDDAAFRSASTWQVKFAAGKFGTPEKLFDGAFHDGISEDNTLAVTGARLLRARIAKPGSTLVQDARDTVWYDGAQACNASLSQDGSKRTAFLDFGGKPGRAFVGENYATHERILIADSSGTLIQSIKAPAGYTFDHSEWASDGVRSNIVATLSNMNGAHTKIVLVNPADSSVTELAESEELWHPVLWVKKAESAPDTLSEDSTVSEYVLDPDSAGIYYNTSGACPYAINFRYKMEFLWQYKDTANTVILGSSRAFYAINPILFNAPVFAINLATQASSISGNSFFFKNYILPHVKNLKALIIALDLDRAYNDGNNANNIFYRSYKSYPGFVYDKNHNYWVDNYPKSLFKKTFEAPGNDSEAKKLRPTRGFKPMDAFGWGKPNVAEDSCWMDTKADEFRANFALLEDLITICKGHDITVIGVIIPLNPKYKDTGAFGYRGLRRSDAFKVIEDLSDLSRTYPNFVLMDENKMGEHDYTDEEALDASHLSKAGATKLTVRIDSLIKTLDIDFGE
jgi:uncharacterized protein (TIGR02171 family)